MTAPDRVMFMPTVEQLEAQVKDLQEQLTIERGYLSVARKAARRRSEGPLLPGMKDQPPETGGEPDF